MSPSSIDRYDFFLISQSIRQGTVMPTSYNVIYDNLGWTPEKVQWLTHKQTHLYVSCVLQCIALIIHQSFFFVCNFFFFFVSCLVLTNVVQCKWNCSCASRLSIRSQIGIFDFTVHPHLSRKHSQQSALLLVV